MLSADEVVRFLEAVPSLKRRAALTTAYAAGLRASEAAFPDNVRRIIYTTNSIESLNAKLRRAVRTRVHFPTGDSALKLLFLVLNLAEREWKMAPREWVMAKAQLAILFEERFTWQRTG